MTAVTPQHAVRGPRFAHGAARPLGASRRPRGPIVPGGIESTNKRLVGRRCKHDDDAGLRRRVAVVCDGRGVLYPLGNVCLTFAGAKVVGYGAEALPLRDWLRKAFIPRHLHENPVVRRMNEKGRRFLRAVFEEYHRVPTSVHSAALRRFHMWDEAVGDAGRLKRQPKFVLRLVEHLQGMTDRYLNEEYRLLFLPGPQGGERISFTVVEGGDDPFARRAPATQRSAADSDPTPPRPESLR